MLRRGMFTITGLILAAAISFMSAGAGSAHAQGMNLGLMAGGAVPATRFAEDRTIGPLAGAFLMISPAMLPTRVRIGGEITWLREPEPDDAGPALQGDRLTLLGGNAFAMYMLPRDPLRPYLLAGGVVTQIEWHGVDGFRRTAAGVGVGGGVELPAWRGHMMAEVRVHALLNAGRPVPVYVPIALGVRF